MDDTKDEDLREIHYHRKKVSRSVKLVFLRLFLGWKYIAYKVTWLSPKERFITYYNYCGIFK